MKSLPTYTNSFFIYLGMMHNLSEHEAFAVINYYLTSQDRNINGAISLIEQTTLINQSLFETNFINKALFEGVLNV